MHVKVFSSSQFLRVYPSFSKRFNIYVILPANDVVLCRFPEIALLNKLGFRTYLQHFYRGTRMYSLEYVVGLCLSVCLSYTDRALVVTHAILRRLINCRLLLLLLLLSVKGYTYRQSFSTIG